MNNRFKPLQNIIKRDIKESCSLYALKLLYVRLCHYYVAAASSGIAYGSAYNSCAGTGSATSATSTVTGLATLPSCGQRCFNSMLAEYGSLGCNSEQDAAGLCENVNFGYGLRDCSKRACGTAVGRRRDYLWELVLRVGHGHGGC